MKLLAILICLVVDQTGARRFDGRAWGWVASFGRRLTPHLATLPSPLVTLAVVGLPWLAGWLLLGLLFEAWVVLGWAGSLLLLYACIGPHDLRPALDDYLQALARGGREAAAPLAVRVAARGQQSDGSLRAMVTGLVCNAHERLFAVGFWFVLLGPLGALLYRLAVEHAEAEVEVAEGRAEAGSAADLRAILDWAPARLLALCYALAGSLTQAFDEWDILSSLRLRDNQRVLAAAGLGALGYRERGAEAAEPRELLDQAQGLVRRGIAIALVLIGLLTLAGMI